MLGEYAAVIKWGIIAALLGGAVFIVRENGYNSAWDKHLGIMKELDEQSEKLKQQEHDKAMIATTQSETVATISQEQHDEALKKIELLESNVTNLTTTASKLRQRSLCTGSENRVPESGNPSIHAEATTEDDSGFSPEFRAFIRSQELRDAENVLWIQDTIAVLTKMCKQPNVVCPPAPSITTVQQN